MGRCIVKLEGKYFEWSTVVDCPVTNPMTLPELEEYVAEEYGKEGLRELPDRLARIEKNGGSSWSRAETAEEACFVNRAGKDETCLSMRQLCAWARGEIEIGWSGPTVGEQELEDDDEAPHA